VLLESDPAAAEAKFREALQLDEKLDVAKIALAQALAAQKKTAAVNEILADLESRGYLEPEAESLKAQMSLDQMATDGPSLDSARAAVAADPKNPAPQFALAEALVANRQYEEALDLCLDLVIAGDEKFAPQAKKAMIDLFQVLGESPLVTKYRRRLSSAVI
jgi:putative thioredoxin